MIAEARERNPGPLGYYESGLALCSYFRGDYREAATWIEKTGMPDNANYHWIAAEIYGESGQTAKASRERDWLMENVPKLVANIRRETAMRIARPQDIERLLSSLRKAGLPIPEEDAAQHVE
jgi:hypothetical protein